MKLQKATSRHEGATTVYTSCICNCGNDSNCVFKAHVKDEVVVAVEPDDRYNTGVGREDEVLSFTEYMELVKTDTGRQGDACDLMCLATDLFLAARQGMILADAQGRIVAANIAAQGLTGYSEDELLGCSPSVFGGVGRGERVARRIRRIVARLGYWEGELRCRRKDGSVYPQQTSVLALPGGGYAALMIDASRRREWEAWLAQVAYSDPLTGLSNRALLVYRLEHALVRARRRRQRLALLFADLDGFKAINDSLGHVFGDALLQSVAKRLRVAVRAEDTLARYGGDEFAVVVEDVITLSDAVNVADKIVAAFARPFQVACTLWTVTASVGIALFPDHGNDAATLVKRADAAMYIAKRAGSNGYRVVE